MEAGQIEKSIPYHFRDFAPPEFKFMAVITGACNEAFIMQHWAISIERSISESFLHYVFHRFPHVTPCRARHI